MLHDLSLSQAFRSILSEAIELTIFLDPAIEDDDTLEHNDNVEDGCVIDDVRIMIGEDFGTCTNIPKRNLNWHSYPLAHWYIKSYGLWMFVSDPLILPPMIEKIDNEEEEEEFNSGENRNEEGKEKAIDSIENKEPIVGGLNLPLKLLVFHGYPLLRTYGEMSMQEIITRQQTQMIAQKGVMDILCGGLICEKDGQVMLWDQEEAEREEKPSGLSLLNVQDVNQRERQENETSLGVDADDFNRGNAVRLETPPKNHLRPFDVLTTYQTSMLFIPYKFANVRHYGAEEEGRACTWRTISDFAYYKIAVASILNEIFYNLCCPMYRVNSATTGERCNSTTTTTDDLDLWARIFLNQVIVHRPALFCPFSVRRLCHYDKIWGDRLSMHVKERNSLNQLVVSHHHLSEMVHLCQHHHWLLQHTEDNNAAPMSPSYPAYPTSQASNCGTYSTSYLPIDELINNLANINRAMALGLYG